LVCILTTHPARPASRSNRAGIEPRHWIAQGRRVGLTEDDVHAAMAAVVARTEPAIAEAAAQIPAEFPADVADAIFDGMRRQARKLGAAG